MKASLIDYMGTDLSVVNAARVSFAKKSEWEDGDIKEDEQGIYLDVKLSDRDTKLINYLARHKHWTPFAHTAITVHVKAPLFVARQLGKHQVGMVWNEVSRRYVKDEPEFYEPEVWRKAADNVKQGSSDEAVNLKSFNQWGEDYEGRFIELTMSEVVNDAITDAVYAYKKLLKIGVAPEQARMALPQSMYTEWYWTGNLVSFANMVKLRTDSHTQRETQEVARQIGDLIAPLFPVSWNALTQGDN